MIMDHHKLTAARLKKGTVQLNYPLQHALLLTCAVINTYHSICIILLPDHLQNNSYQFLTPTRRRFYWMLLKRWLDDRLSLFCP